MGGVILSYKRLRCYQLHSGRSKRQLAINGFKNEPQAGEDEYIRLWSQITKRVEPYSYRLFSHYMGNVPYIIPEDIGQSYLEHYLDPVRFCDFYNDKNLYPQYMNLKGHLPKTIARRISGGQMLDEEYKPLKQLPTELPYEALILKPSVDTGSGKGVMRFAKSSDGYYSDNVKLTDDFLMQYSQDFILQEAVRQHAFFMNLNETSVNTMRLCLYRSVKTEEVILTGGVVRVGHKGAYVDNAHMGGRYVGILAENGELMKTTFDQDGRKKDIHNDIDYSKVHMTIPNWEEVKRFALYIGEQNRHCRLIALDVSMNELGVPILIEINVAGFSYWLQLFTGQDPFAGHVDEVIEYCLKKETLRKKGKY